MISKLSLPSEVAGYVAWHGLANTIDAVRKKQRGSFYASPITYETQLIKTKLALEIRVGMLPVVLALVHTRGQWGTRTPLSSQNAAPASYVTAKSKFWHQQSGKVESCQVRSGKHGELSAPRMLNVGETNSLHLLVRHTMVTELKTIEMDVVMFSCFDPRTPVLEGIWGTPRVTKGREEWWGRCIET